MALSGRKGDRDMPIGQFTQDTVYGKTPSETIMDLEKALNIIGNVQSVDRTALTIHGKTKYGLQTVNIRATITGSESNSKITIDALSDDAWGAGAKNGIQRLLEALQNIENPDYQPNRTGISSTNLALRVALFLIIFVIVFGGWVTGYIPGSVMRIIFALGAGLLVYFMVAKAKFGKK